MAAEDITRILVEAGGRPLDPRVIDRLFTATLSELQAIARRLMRSERPGHTLQPTAIVNEAYVRLVGRELQLQSRTHFYRVAVRAMRQVLVDHARRRGAAKRGGKQKPVPLLVDIAFTGGAELEMLALDRALTGLEDVHERMARVAELRLFGGLESEEIAAALGVSRRTVQGDWKVAQMWLKRALSSGA